MRAQLEAATRRRSDFLTTRAETLLLERRAGGVRRVGRPRRNPVLGDAQVTSPTPETSSKGFSERVTEYRSELERCGTIPQIFSGSMSRTVSSAGRLSPLACPPEELRRLHSAALRGEGASYERRFTTAVPDIPPELSRNPTAAIHDLRILNRLPGYGITAPSVEYVRHISTTGTAGPVAEGALKPEVTLVVDKLTATAVKLAGHLGAVPRSHRRLGRLQSELHTSRAVQASHGR